MDLCLFIPRQAFRALTNFNTAIGIRYFNGGFGPFTEPMVKRCLVSLVLLLSGLPALGQDYIPRDVQRFVDRREACDRIRRDKDVMNEASRELRKLCSGTDKELVQLKRKYAPNSTIMQILNQFDVGIEVAEAPARRK